jgi:hypothetical protein
MNWIDQRKHIWRLDDYLKIYLRIKITNKKIICGLNCNFNSKSNWSFNTFKDECDSDIHFQKSK